jgi:hypothetical protein
MMAKKPGPLTKAVNNGIAAAKAIPQRALNGAFAGKPKSAAKAPTKGGGSK